MSAAISAFVRACFFFSKLLVYFFFHNSLTLSEIHLDGEVFLLSCTRGVEKFITPSARFYYCFLENTFFSIEKNFRFKPNVEYLLEQYRYASLRAILLAKKKNPCVKKFSASLILDRVKYSGFFTSSGVE